MQPLPPQSGLTAQRSSSITTCQAPSNDPGKMAKRQTDETGPLAKRTKYDFKETITVLVGPDGTVFTLHKGVVCAGSSFFRDAMSANSKQARTRIVRLPEFHPTVFEVYAGWLYTNNVDVSTVLHEDGTTSTKSYASMLGDDAGELTRCFINAFALGDTLQDVGFCNSVVDEFMDHIKVVRKVPSPTSVRVLCRIVPTQSTLMKLCADYAAVDLRQERFNEVVHEYPTAFVTQIAQASVSDRELCMADRSPAQRDRCLYREHPEGEGRTKSCSVT